MDRGALAETTAAIGAEVLGGHVSEIRHDLHADDLAESRLEGHQDHPAFATAKSISENSDGLTSSFRSAPMISRKVQIEVGR
jgi:hypothetical protein